MNLRKSSSIGAITSLLILLSVSLGCSLFTGSVNDVSFDASSDGRQIVFSTSGDLYVFDMESKKVTRITETEGEESTPSFSPDGKSVVYAATAPDDSSARRIFKIDLATKQTVQLTKDSGVSDSSPSFDPEGKKIYFARDFRSQQRPTEVRWTDGELMVMNADGSDLKQLTKAEYSYVSGPVPLPDGKTVLFQAAEWRGEGEEIYFSESVYALDLAANGKPADFGAVELETRLDGIGIADDKGGPDSDAEIGEDGGAQMAPELRFVAVGGMIADLKTRKAAWAGKQFGEHLQSPRFVANDRILFIKVIGDDRMAYDYELWSIGLDAGDPQKIAGELLFADPMNWKPSQ